VIRDGEVTRALAALAHRDVREALSAMGEDPAIVLRYLESDLAGIRQKGIDRVREAQARTRRGPTPFTVNTSLRLYEPIEIKVQRAALHRALEKHCKLSPAAAALLADLATWGEVPIEAGYYGPSDELRRRGLAEIQAPLAHDRDARVRVAPTPFVAKVMEQIGPLLVLDEAAKAMRATSRKRARRS
jgi:hypothetical protein